MWAIKLFLTTLWMAGMVAGWTIGGLLHVLALMVIALVLIEETPFEQKLRKLPTMSRLRFLLPHPREVPPGHSIPR